MGDRDGWGALEARPAEAGRSEGRPSVRPGRTGPRRILVVDDQAAIHADFDRVLVGEARPASDGRMRDLEAALYSGDITDAVPVTTASFELTHAYSGVDALAAVEAATVQGAPFSVAFVDVRMPPGWDGLETARHLRQAQPDLEVVFCTAYSDRGYEEFRAALGDEGWLVLKKPYDPVEIEQLARCLSAKWTLNGAQRDHHRALEAEVRRRTDALEVSQQALQRANGELEAKLALLKAAHDQIADLAHRDPLTGLPNRRSLDQQLGILVDQAQRQGSVLAVLFVDVDGFRRVNETLGHRRGDEALVEISRRVKQAVRASDCVVRASDETDDVDLSAGHAALDSVIRLGGDEFIVALSTVASVPDAAHVAQRILRNIGETLRLGSEHLQLSASVGVALYPGNGDDAESLLLAADEALRQAKARGGGVLDFAPGEAARPAVDALRLEREIRLAVEQRELELWYQPQVQAEGQGLVGVEALLRWRSPTRGLVSPLDFIPVAERIGAIVPIGEWVLGEALRQAVAWRAQGLELDYVGVNWANRQLQVGSTVACVERALAAAGWPGSRLILELTEDAILDDPERLKATIEGLSALGVRVALDDFGTGYASLSHLLDLPVHHLKIDRRFVRTLPGDQRCWAVARSMLALGSELGAMVVAEGVENEATASLLAEAGCPLLQGYWIAKPMPAADFEAWWAERCP